MPNQTLGLVEWNAGIVSRIVTMADKRMRKVVAMWMTKAEGLEFGCSKRACKDRFHGEWMEERGIAESVAEEVMAAVDFGKKDWSSTSRASLSASSSAGDVRFAFDRRAEACGKRDMLLSVANLYQMKPCAYDGFSVCFGFQCRLL